MELNKPDRVKISTANGDDNTIKHTHTLSYNMNLMKLVIFVFFLFEAVVESDNSLFGASYTSILCEILLFQLTTSQILV